MLRMFRLLFVALCMGMFIDVDCANANIIDSVKDKVEDVKESVSDKVSDIKENVEEKIDEHRDEDTDDDDDDDKDDGDKDKDDKDGKNDKESESKKSETAKDTGAVSNSKSTDSDKKLQELKDNAQKMKDKEQSTANKLLGAAAIGTVGIGGMNIASALSEQSADESAERDMRAYLATFSCDYGAGRNIRGGETGIELPGGNDLTPLVAEYRALAADIAQRKAALGMAPGIEAEAIFDKSETGLYDNVGIERQSGAFTSLARALSDENSADAAQWQAQKDATSKKLKTGAIVAGIGVVGSIAGNLIINNKNKNESDKLLAEYQALKKLESDVNNLPHDDNTTVQCNCTSRQVCNQNVGCEDCPGDKVAVNNECKCPDARPVELAGDICVASVQNVTLQCTPDVASHLVVDNPTTGTCRCVDGYIPNDASRPTSCMCPTDTHEEQVSGNSVQCVKKSPVQNPTVAEPERVTLSADALFDTGRYTIKSAAVARISEFAGSVKAQNKTTYCITIIGNTDKTGTDKINIPLSKNRAIAVAKQLVETNGLSATHVCAMGDGSMHCDTPGNQPSCRNVQMSYDSSTNCASSNCLPLNYVK